MGTRTFFSVCSVRVLIASASSGTRVGAGCVSSSGPDPAVAAPAGCLGCILGAGLGQATGLLASKLKFPARGGRFRTRLEEESQVCACVCLLYTVFLHGE